MLKTVSYFALPKYLNTSESCEEIISILSFKNKSERDWNIYYRRLMLIIIKYF